MYLDILLERLGYFKVPLKKQNRLAYKIRDTQESIILNRHFYNTWNPTTLNVAEESVYLAKNALDSLEDNSTITEAFREEMREVLQKHLQDRIDGLEHFKIQVSNLEEEFLDLKEKLIEFKRIEFLDILDKDLNDEIDAMEKIPFDETRSGLELPDAIVSDVDNKAVIEKYKLNDLNLGVFV